MASAAELPPNTVVARSPDQISGDVDGKVVLLSIENGEYYNMNEVGSRIWQLLEQPMTVTTLVERLVAEYEVEHATCVAEVGVFLAKLQQDKLLRTEATPA